MSETTATQASKLDQQLDGAYPRALKTTVALSAIALAAAGLAAGWRSSLGVLMGAAIGILNLVWLHQGAEMLVRRMMVAGASNAEGGPSAAGSGPSKPRLMLFFPLRYIAVIAAVYAILKGYPGVLVSFLVGLVLPILALMGEGIYEAVAFRQDRPRLP
jgi:predicted outer membrane lipoprotein